MLAYPVTTGDTEPPARLRRRDRATSTTPPPSGWPPISTPGRDVVVLAEGDPLFYSSYMYLHDRLAGRYETEIVPGVTSVSAAAAAVATPAGPPRRRPHRAARHPARCRSWPAGSPTPTRAMIMKLGRTFPAVARRCARPAGSRTRCYVERASTGAEQSCCRWPTSMPAVPYFSMIVVPGRTAGPTPRTPRRTGRATERRPAADGPRAARRRPGPRPGPVAHPGGRRRRWPTSTTSSATARTSTGCPQREGLQRHASGNTVEVDRARVALDLALAGERVAVVSGGDAGVFGMAAAVFEAAAGPAYADVPDHACSPA